MKRELGRLLERTIAVVRRRHRTVSKDCGLLLDRVITDLEGLNRATEQDFLTIGGNLMGFVTGARQLSSDMAALEQIFGRQDGQASQVLSRVLERSQQMEARAEAGDQALAGVCDSARHIGRTFRGFQDTVSVFRVLGSLTRIETARLGNAGEEFGNLAEEVTTLTKSIEASGQGILDASAALHQKLQSALAKVTGLRASELAELPILVGEVETGLRSLEERHRQAIEVFLRQAAEYEKVSAAFEDLITAIQFHDITRQQVEHVVDALRRLRTEFQGCRNRSENLDVRAVLALQSSQLSNAEQVFGSSVGRIERDLDGIAGRVREMAETSKTLIGSSANEQDSFFLQMEGRFTAILKVVGTCAEADVETQSVLGELEATVKGMRDSVAEIRQIEIRIRRMAINATIRAIQIGNAGSALNVVAEVMQRLALDSGGITDTVAGDLDAISDAANRLSGGSGWTQSGEESETGSVLPEMRAALLELHSSSEASASRLSQITATSARLSEEIRSVRANFSAGAIFTETILSACSTLDGIGGQAKPVVRDSKVAAAQHLEDLASRYTMQAERDVHQSLTTGAANPPAPADRSAEVPFEEGLGANVELF
jgi:alkylated DNA nucleotide flippase Atl1